MIFKQSKYSGPNLGERVSSIRGGLVLEPLTGSNSDENDKELNTDSVADLLSCIKTWQSNPLAGRIGVRNPIPELLSNRSIEGDVGYMRGNLSMQIPIQPQLPPGFKRFMYPNDVITDMRTVFRTVGNAAPRGMRLSLLPAIDECSAPVNSPACGRVDHTIPSYDALQKEKQVIPSPRPVTDESFVDVSSNVYRDIHFSALHGDGEDISSTPRLVYLGSSENNVEERLSESEENPLLAVGTDRYNDTIITPRDIMVYGRYGSVNDADGPFLSNGNPQGSKVLKDVSLNCQIEHIKSRKIRARRVNKVRALRNSNVEDYAQKASEMEKIRGVCYCRSDNSWTAWWTEKGRNRKKAFKVSRFGFHEARSRAITHRMCIEEKIPELRAKFFHKDIFSDPSVDIDRDDDTMCPSYDTTPSSGLQNSPISPSSPILHSNTRMQTRHGCRTPEFELVPTETDAYRDVFSRSLANSTSEGYVDSLSVTSTPVEYLVTPKKFDLASPTTTTIIGDGLTTEGAEMMRTPTSGKSLDNFPELAIWDGEGLLTEHSDQVSTYLATENHDHSCSSMNATPEDRSGLNYDMMEFVTLDRESSNSVNIALSTVALGMGGTVLPSGETVRVLPHIATGPGGRKVTAVLILDP